MRRLGGRLILWLLCLGMMTACWRTQTALVQQESFVFGTRVEVLVSGESEERAQAGIGIVLREFDRLHRSYHAWQDSELTALNRDIAAGRPHQVSAELAELIRRAQALSRAAEGLFDPGIGQLIALWGFQNDEFKPQLPPSGKLAAWHRAQPSINDLEVDGLMVRSRNPAVALDFGGYLKGWALDRAAALLHQQGINNALINIGGNVMALGSKDGKPWTVGIQDPRGPQPLASVELLDGEAIGTSGDYQRYFILDGRRYSHLLDPATAAPAAHSQSLTLVMPSGAEAGLLSDVLSKPLFIAGDNWMRLAAKLDVQQVLRVAANGQIEVTPGMEKRLHKLVDTPFVVRRLPLQ